MPFSGGKQGFFLCIKQPKNKTKKKTKQQKQQRRV